MALTKFCNHLNNWKHGHRSDWFLCPFFAQFAQHHEGCDSNAEENIMEKLFALVFVIAFLVIGVYLATGINLIAVIFG